ncbi:MAG: xylose isomerase [Candidatus Poribacteria bacterium]|nr:MAG: xylose isomerase [Candidatus Poribacteria bacterium]
MSRIPVGVCAYSFAYAIGWMRGMELEGQRRMTAEDLIRLATEHGLSGVELPPQMLGEGETPARIRELLDSLGLYLVLDGGLVLSGPLEEWIQTAHTLGARTLRLTLSRVLCGDRSEMAGHWQEHLNAIASRLQAVEPLARKLGVSLALENHQDADSDDLRSLCERIGSPVIGVNLDVGNALAVGEDPLEFAKKVAPFLKNVHLKDYQMVRSPEGYRLVRCAVGEGVVDWPGIFQILEEQASTATCNIELGAIKERHIRLFTPEWWAHYPARDVRTLLGPLRLLATHGLPPETETRVPIDRGESVQAQLAYEMGQFQASVAYLKRLFQKRSGEDASAGALRPESRGV